MAKYVGVPLLSSAAMTLRKRLYGILNAMKHRVTELSNYPDSFHKSPVSVH